jgi:aminopeptidase
MTVHSLLHVRLDGQPLIGLTLAKLLPMYRSFDENLALYAKLTVRAGLALAAGQELLIFAELVSAPFVRLVAIEAYKAGAKNVEVLWSDPELVLAKFREGSDEAMQYAPRWRLDGVARAHRENAARLAVSSADPGLLAAISSEKVAVQDRVQGVARKAISDLVTDLAMNWCLVGGASPAWAARVFPYLPADQAVARLCDAMPKTLDIGEPFRQRL